MGYDDILVEIEEMCDTIEENQITVASMIFELLIDGNEPDFDLIDRAEACGVDITAIRAKVNELFPLELEDEQELDFH